MPPPETVLAGLTRIARDWQALAAVWHVLLGTMLLGVVLGWRPSNRLAACLIASALGSVSLLAWTSGNPFNGAAFALLAVLPAARVAAATTSRVQVAPLTFTAAGAALVVFAWVYPHFLESSRWTAYLYAAPLGLVPCPTLAAALGLTLMLGRLDSTVWNLTLAAAGLLYGGIGLVRLGVALDVGLVAGAAMALLAERDARTRTRRPPRAASAGTGRPAAAGPGGASAA